MSWLWSVHGSGCAFLSSVLVCTQGRDEGNDFDTLLSSRYMLLREKDLHSEFWKQLFLVRFVSL